MAATRYIVLIDAGSSGSRLSIFKSPHRTVGQPLVRLGIKQIFPAQGQDPVESDHVIENCGGGIHCTRVEHGEEDVYAHLVSILDLATDHLDTVPDAAPDNTDIYLLATGGMRNLGQNNPDNHDFVLDRVRNFISERYEDYFTFNPTNIRTITGQQEGWLAWTYLNYGRRENQYRPMAVLEMGGASLQYANTVEDDPHARVICTNKGGPLREENVYARSWDTLGADAYNNWMVDHLPVVVANPRNNPCLPTGQAVTAQNGVQSVGTGNFAACRELATAIYNHFQFPALPLNVPTTDQFEALSNYWFTYHFFSTRPPGNVYNPLGPYIPETFNAVVGQYCNNDWANEEGWAGAILPAFTQRHCLIAAAMLNTLGHEPIDNMRPIIIRRSLPWTWGAAALIANHGGLKLCPTDEQELPPFLPPQPLVGNLNVSLAQIPPTFTPHALVQPAIIVPAPSVPLWAYLSFAAALVFIGRLLVQRYRAKALGKISLPDMESALGVKGDMRDLGGAVQDLEGFYKD